MGDVKELVTKLIRILYEGGYNGVYPEVPLSYLKEYFSEGELKKLMKYLQEQGLVEYVDRRTVRFLFRIFTPNVVFFDELPRHENVEIEYRRPFTTHDIDIVVRKLSKETIKYLEKLYEKACNKGLIGLHICVRTRNNEEVCEFAYCPRYIHDKYQMDLKQTIEYLKKELQRLGIKE